MLGYRRITEYRHCYMLCSYTTDYATVQQAMTVVHKGYELVMSGSCQDHATTAVFMLLLYHTCISAPAYPAYSHFE